MTTNEINAAILRITAKWATSPHVENLSAAYEAAAAEVESGAEKMSDEVRAIFTVPGMGTLGPRSYRSTSRLTSELRQAVYNASTAQTLTANQNAVDQELAVLGMVASA